MLIKMRFLLFHLALNNRVKKNPPDPPLKLESPGTSPPRHKLKMPYSADLRSAYGFWEMNMAWIYSCMRDDFHLDFTFKEEDDRLVFENQVDVWATHYIAYKLFSGKSMTSYLGAQYYETIWEFLYDKISNYIDDFQSKTPELIEVERTED